jgi:hypothetical protein
MDTDNQLWSAPAERAVRNSLNALMACPAEADVDTGRQIDSVACNWFLAKALEKLYGVEDFSKSKNGKWLSANEIADFVRATPSLWSQLGIANSQPVLNEAARGAANGQPVVAIQKGNPHGHVAVILPGTPKPSSIWKDAAGKSLLAPNSAAFSLNNVNAAYISCRLSAAFTDPSNVEIWWRLKGPNDPVRK